MYIRGTQALISNKSTLRTSRTSQRISLDFLSRTKYATGDVTDAIETIHTRLMEMDIFHFHTKMLFITFEPSIGHAHLIDGFDDALQMKMTITGPRKGITTECKRILHTTPPKRPRAGFSAVVKKWPTGMIPNIHYRETEITGRRGWESVTMHELTTEEVVRFRVMSNQTGKSGLWLESYV